MAEKDKQRIVYVEDDQDMVELVQMMLDRMRFNIVGAKDGTTGLDLILQAPTELVLLDLLLPDIGGWAVYQTMEADPDLSKIPVIVVTGQKRRSIAAWVSTSPECKPISRNLSAPRS